jgi:hypothetical protein
MDAILGFALTLFVVVAGLALFGYAALRWGVDTAFPTDLRLG